MRNVAAWAVWLTALGSVGAEGFSLRPTSIALTGREATQRLLVQGASGKDRARDAAYASDNPGVATVSASGVVRGAQRPPTPTFERDIEPILARTGCNSGPCHGKSRGQNGFQLSLLGYDPDFDYQAIAFEGRGRRVLPGAMEKSLFLQKPAGLAPHGGGKKIQPGDRHYRALLHWLEAGMPRTPADAPKLLRIAVDPTERILVFGEEQQLAVTAHFSDGSSQDVTDMAMFQSSESVIVAVTPEGRIKAGPIPGEAAIMARYMEKFAVANVLIPQPKAIPAALYEKLPVANVVDRHVWEKLQKLNVVPSGPASDATFLRRATLDVLGRLPTLEEARAYFADTSPNKKETLVDRLLARPEYADHWANKWADLLRPNPYRVGVKAVFSLDAFLRESFRENKPYDRFAREIVAAQGSTWRNGAAVVFRDRREPDEIATLMSQLFLGVRLECAKCHHHPFEIWSQDDFYSFAAYFAKVGRKGIGLSPPISGGEEVVYHGGGKGVVKHPVTQQPLAPRPLIGAAAELKDDVDPRRALPDWIVDGEHGYFAKVAVNRVWADLMGRGIVEPVDDLRATNPPSNGPLLDALADHFRKEKYDFKKLLRTILTSHAYALSSTPNPDNVADLRNYSRHYRQRLRAETLLDAVCDVTGVPEKFGAAPIGTRAMALWTVRTESFFLDAFSRPDPNQDPPCERAPETTVVQALHLMNSPALHQKVTSDQGRAAALAASKQSPDEIVEEIYLRIYTRLPDAVERSACRRLFETLPRRQAIEDIMWSLLNTPEFVMKD